MSHVLESRRAPRWLAFAGWLALAGTLAVLSGGTFLAGSDIVDWGAADEQMGAVCTIVGWLLLAGAGASVFKSLDAVR